MARSFDDASLSATERPFSWTPLAVVSYCLFVNCYVLVNLFPYVGFMVASFGGVPHDSVGYYAGYVASSFTLGRFLSSYFWGWMADRVGRKPVMVWSMACLAILSILFGMSQTFAMAVTVRFIMGLVNGTMSSGIALIVELAGKERSVAGMAYVDGARGVGLTLGPALGGLLSEPAKHYPGVFGSVQLFARFPYLLPNLIPAGLTVIAVPLIIFCIPETDKLKLDRRGGAHSKAQKSSSLCSPPAVSEKGDNIHRKTTSGTLIAKVSPPVLTPGGYDFTPLEPSADTEDTMEKLAAAKAAEPATTSTTAGGAMGNHGMKNIRNESSFTGVANRNIGGEHGDGDVEDGGKIRLLLPSKLAGGEQSACGASGRNFHGAVDVGGRVGTEGNDSDKERRGQDDADAVDDADSGGVDIGVFGRRGLLTKTFVPTLLFMAFIASATIIGFDEAFPLWALSSREAGGLRWNSIQIAKVLATAGVGIIFYQFFVYPRLVPVVGLVRLQRVGLIVTIVGVFALPNLTYLPWNYGALYALSAIILTLLLCGYSMTMQGIMLASMKLVPAHQRGKLSGLFLMSQSLGRTIGPAAWSNMYAWSISASHMDNSNGGNNDDTNIMQFVGHRFVFIVSSIIFGVTFVLSMRTLTLESMTKAEPDSLLQVPTSPAASNAGDSLPSCRESDNGAERDGARVGVRGWEDVGSRGGSVGGALGIVATPTSVPNLYWTE